MEAPGRKHFHHCEKFYLQEVLLSVSSRLTMEKQKHWRAFSRGSWPWGLKGDRSGNPPGKGVSEAGWQRPCYKAIHSHQDTPYPTHAHPIPGDRNSDHSAPHTQTHTHLDTLMHGLPVGEHRYPHSPISRHLGTPHPDIQVLRQPHMWTQHRDTPVLERP